MSQSLPLDGVRVVEFSHMVMGPSCGMILADLGAEVIKVEPAPKGDNTRRLVGSGAGYFAAYNRNKKSIVLDLKVPADHEAALRLVANADVFLENFRPGALAAQGFGYDDLSRANPRLVYCSLKGFLAGPYEERTALDEVVQMMSGLAFMTGLPGRPLRCGASVNDVMGGMFGAIAILAALRQRDITGHGQYVQSGLFENAAFLVAQHMMQHVVTGTPPKPMSVRQPAWGVYDIFETADGQPMFVGVVTDRQWEIFTHKLADARLTDPAYATNSQRVKAREVLIPLVGGVLKRFTAAELESFCEHAGLPFARIGQPSDLFEDPHLNAGDGMIPITLPDGRATKLPALPLSFSGHRLGLRRDLPKVGEHTQDVLKSLSDPRSSS